MTAAPAPADHGPPAAGAVRAVVFDCYGTLIDFDERAFAPAIDRLLRRAGVRHVDGAEVWRHWMESARDHAKQHGRDPQRPLEGPEPPFVSFADLWPRHFARAFHATGVVGIEPATALAHLFAQLSAAPPYDEAPGVLAQLREAGLRVAVASNADDAHLFPALERAGLAADAVISSQRVQSYKPRRPFFHAVLAQLALPPEQVVFVGDSPYADVTGARAAGLYAYWVRRYIDPQRDALLHHPPTWTFPDLRGLLTVLAKGAP